MTNSLKIAEQTRQNANRQEVQSQPYTRVKQLVVLGYPVTLQTGLIWLYDAPLTSPDLS